MWFTQSTAIGPITTTGELKEYPLPVGNGSGSPYQIASGPDGNLWFVEYLPEGIGRVGRITTSGQLT
jgi:streptogramin lyase